MNKIKYLIKFINKEKYVKDLINIDLYMNPACFYHKAEARSLQWDYSEGSIGDFCGYKNSESPIWCCTAIFEENIVNNTIILDKKILEDFNCKNGYAVIINVDNFFNAINTNPQNYYALTYGLVKYGPKNTESIIKDENFASALFIKYPKFSYQQEFRICIACKCDKIFDKDINNVFGLGTEQEIVVGYHPFIYKIQNIKEYAQVLTSKDFIKNDEIRIDLKILNKKIFNLKN